MALILSTKCVKPGRKRRNEMKNDLISIYQSPSDLQQMLKAIALTKNITPFLKPTRPISVRPLSKNYVPIFSFSENKGGLPRNKEEAWMMQEQQRLKGVEDESDKVSYGTMNKYGWMAMGLLSSSLAYMIYYASKKSEENLDFYEEEITGLRELKEKKSEIGGDWTLIDSQGRPFSSNMLSGTYYLVYFGLTNCPDHCPNILYYMSTIFRTIRNIPEGAYVKLKLVFISVDPERDTPRQMKKFVSNFNKNMIGVTSEKSDEFQLREVMRKFKVFAKKVENEESSKKYKMNHISNIMLMGPQNDYLYHVEESLTQQQAAKAILAEIVKNEHKKDKQYEKLRQ